LSKLYSKSALLGIERVRGKQPAPAKRRITKQADRMLSVRAQAQSETDARKLAKGFIYLDLPGPGQSQAQCGSA